jgi:UDP-glucose:(heptosyl)LPS alpha-1,3-glucosyltransferase
MRIALAHLRHAPTGGTERYLDRLAAHLAARGHEVVIVCRSHARAPHAAVRFHVLHGLAVGGAWRMWGFARGRSSATSRARATTSWSAWARPGRRTSCAWVAAASARTSSGRTPATLTPRDRLLGSGSVKHALAVRIEERALAQPATHVVTNSEMVRRDVLARYAIDGERVTTIHNGVDLERFHPRLRAEAGAARRRELGLGPDETVVLFLGTGYARKGLDVVLEAFPQVRAAHPAARLVVAGFDSARPRYEARARASSAARTSRASSAARSRPRRSSRPRICTCSPRATTPSRTRRSRRWPRACR